MLKTKPIITSDVYRCHVMCLGIFTKLILNSQKFYPENLVLRKRVSYEVFLPQTFGAIQHSYTSNHRVLACFKGLTANVYIKPYNNKALKLIDAS